MRQTSSIKLRASSGCRVTAADFGFTLIEFIVVIVLISILGSLVALMGNPIRGGIDGQRRAELADAADTAYRRMARDLRRALPNSIRLVSATEIELIPTKDGGRYQDITDGLGTGTALSFTDATVDRFTVLGPAVTVQANDFITINNWGTGSLSAYCALDTCNNRAKVSSLSGADIVMISNPFPALGDSGPSPGNRFHVIDKDEQAVTYTCTGGTLTRRWGYGFNHGAGGSSAILAQNIACDFGYVAFDAALWGLLHLRITMSRADLADNPVTLVYQLHVDNTP